MTQVPSLLFVVLTLSTTTSIYVKTLLIWERIYIDSERLITPTLL